MHFLGFLWILFVGWVSHCRCFFPDGPKKFRFKPGFWRRGHTGTSKTDGAPWQLTESLWLWVKNTGYLKNLIGRRKKKRPIHLWSPRVFFLTHSHYGPSGLGSLFEMTFPWNSKLLAVGEFFRLQELNYTRWRSSKNTEEMNINKRTNRNTSKNCL